MAGTQNEGFNILTRLAAPRWRVCFQLLSESRVQPAYFTDPGEFRNPYFDASSFRLRVS